MPERTDPWFGRIHTLFPRLRDPRIERTIRAKRGSMLCAAQSTDCHRSLVCAQHLYHHADSDGGLPALDHQQAESSAQG